MYEYDDFYARREIPFDVQRRHYWIAAGVGMGVVSAFGVLVWGLGWNEEGFLDEWTDGFEDWVLYLWAGVLALGALFWLVPWIFARKREYDEWVEEHGPQGLGWPGERDGHG